MLSRKILLVLLMSCCVGTVLAQQKATLSGYVKDANNGEELIGVTIFVEDTQTGTTTNTYGFYSITLPPR